MASARMTMIGLYNYDNTLFDNLTFPSGIDKDLAINQILMSCGEFELLYPNLEFMKFQIENWGKKYFFTFDKWVKALAEEFNPIHNYDRHEEFEDEHKTGQQTDRTSRGNAATANGTTASNLNSTQRDVSAYDSASYQPKEKETGSGSNSASGNAITSSNDISKDVSSGTENIKHKAHIYGNIGVTTSTAMLTEYTNFYKNFNIYEQIADLFVNEFCIRLY